MAVMEKGFYCVGQNIYYGLYPQGQVSGYSRISAVKPEFVKTDVLFLEDDVAVRLYDNHACWSRKVNERI